MGTRRASDVRTGARRRPSLDLIAQPAVAAIDAHNDDDECATRPSFPEMRRGRASTLPRNCHPRRDELYGWFFFAFTHWPKFL